METTDDKQTDLEVRLEWPGGGPEDAVAPMPLASCERAKRGDSAGTDNGSTGSFGLADRKATLGSALPTSLPGGADGASLQAALVAVTVRLDALANATSTLRTIISDQLADFSKLVSRSNAATQREVGDYRRLNERSLSSLEEGLKATDEAVHRVERSIKALAERPAPELDLSGVQTEVAAVRQEVGELTPLVRAQAEVVAGLESGLAAVVAALERIDERQDASQVHIARLSQQLDATLESIDKLRRRISLRARQEPLIDGAALEAIAEAVARRLAPSLEQGRRGRLLR